LHGPLTEVCSATPVAVYTKSKNPVGTPLDFALKTVVFDQLTPDEKNRVSDLEIHLDHLISMKRHENCAKVLHFRSCAVESGWEMSILMEFSHRGSLEVELKSTDTIPGNRLRPWTIDLLEALESDHQNQLVHSRIHARNILLFQSPNGAIKITLSDASFQQKLYDVKATRVSTSTYPSDWEPPELAAGQRTRKTDIWDLGIVFVQMLFGLGVTDKYAGPVALIQSGSLSPPLVYLLRQFFNKNPIKRPSAFEIIPSEFLKREHPISASEYHDQLVLSSGRRSSMNKTRSVRVRENSRYNRDFYEHVTIGKGGFGEVVRARSRFDKQLYAIKKISQKTHAQMQTVLTEVMILSQIKHHNVVRYDGAWEEDDTSPTPSEAVESDESDESTETGFVSTSKQGGLDFIHSEGIAFEHGSSDEEDEEDSDVDTDVELKKGGIDFAHSGEIVFENDSSDEEGDKPDTEAAGSEK
jgi:translation initiation factor 2-alpha kinase 4